MRIVFAILLTGVAVSSGWAQDRARSSRAAPADARVAAPERAVVATASIAQPEGQTLVAGDVPFTGVTLEPRRPYVAGRGHLEITDSDWFDAGKNEVTLRPRTGMGPNYVVNVYLNVPAGRHLVTCRIEQSIGMTYRINEDTPIDINPVTAGEHELVFFIEPEASGWTGFSLYALPPGEAYTFRGCEVTPEN